MKKKLLALALVLVMVLGLAACGKDKGDPNEIVIGDYTAYYTGAKIVEDSDGDDAIAIFFDFTNNSDEAASFLWSMYYKATQNGTELEDCTVFLSEDSFDTLFDSSMEDVAPGETLEVALTYKLADPAAAVEIEFTDLFESEKDHLTVDLATIGAEETAAPEKDAAPENPQTEKTDDPTELSYWAGDYYGWWVIDSVWEGEDFEEGDWWDCCATIELDEDGTGTMILWDEDMPKDDPLAELGITVTVDANGVARFCSEEGWFLDDEMEHADWVFYSDATEYGDVLYIDGEYEDGTYDFWYYIYLRPWGTDWSDVAESAPEDMPYYYEDWYLPLIESGVQTAPDTIADGVSVEEAPAEESEEEPEETEAPADAGEGVVELQQLKDWKAWHKETNSNANNYYKPTIDECVEAMGVEPAAWNVEKWEEDVQIFKWTTPDGKDHIILTIKPDDNGVWRYHSFSWSSGVND